MKKIGGLVPETFDISLFVCAIHILPHAATPCHAAHFLYSLSIPIIICKIFLKMLCNLRDP